MNPVTGGIAAELESIHMNLGNVLKRSASYWSSHLAAVDTRRRLTYAELERETNRLVSGLMAMGFDAGSHIAIQAPNCTELVAAELAFYKGAMVKAPLNARLTPDETIHTINDSHAVALIASPAHAEVLSDRRSEMPRLKTIISIGDGSGDMTYADVISLGQDSFNSLNPADEALAVLHYTSGSSGVLKAAMQSYGNRRALLRKNLIAPRAQSKQIHSVVGHVGPITHASGMQILPVTFFGGCNVLFERFDIDNLLATIEKEGINRLFLVPTMITRVLASGLIGKYDLSSLSSLTYGAAPMPPAVVRQTIEAFGPIVSQGYGAGETTSTVTVLTADDHIEALKGDGRRLASCGRSYFECEVMVLKDDGSEAAPGELGEICVRGPDIMQGYWNAPELTAEVLKDGLYHTGDIAMTDDEGYIFIVDRKKEMIISGGFNVYPSEVEKVLYTHPSVFEAAVVGVPDAEWGEAVKAVVVVRKGHDVSEAELLEYCREGLPGFKRPRSVDFIDELPRNPNGKIVRRQVRDTYWKTAERMV